MLKLKKQNKKWFKLAAVIASSPAIEQDIICLLFLFPQMCDTIFRFEEYIGYNASTRELVRYAYPQQC